MSESLFEEVLRQEKEGTFVPYLKRLTNWWRDTALPPLRKKGKILLQTLGEEAPTHKKK